MVTATLLTFYSETAKNVTELIFVVNFRAEHKGPKPKIALILCERVLVTIKRES